MTTAYEGKTGLKNGVKGQMIEKEICCIRDLSLLIPLSTGIISLLNLLITVLKIVFRQLNDQCKDLDQFQTLFC